MSYLLEDQKFQQQVISDLAVLKTHMYDLVGNGQPGRISTIEGRIMKLTIGLVLLVVSLFGPSAVAWVLH